MPVCTHLFRLSRASSNVHKHTVSYPSNAYHADCWRVLSPSTLVPAAMRFLDKNKMALCAARIFGLQCHDETAEPCRAWLPRVYPEAFLFLCLLMLLVWDHFRGSRIAARAPHPDKNAASPTAPAHDARLVQALMMKGIAVTKSLAFFFYCIYCCSTA